MHTQTALATNNIVGLNRQWVESQDGDYTFADIRELCAFLQSEIQRSKRTYKYIAEKAGCCAQTVSNMASGSTNYPRAATVFEILRVLGFQVVVRQ